jgi:2,3-bisphosphoglycerate-dependent phosphoglycerate mutase
MNDYQVIHTMRHGETEFNRQKKYAGSTDISLNNKGIRDTVEASQKIKEFKFDVVITSALKRSEETARLLLGEDTPIVKCDLCNERNYGGMQGLTSAEVESIIPRIKYIRVGGDYHSLNPPGGESFQALRSRARRFHTFVFQHYRGLNILIVSHGVFLQQFHGILKGLTVTESLGSMVGNLEITSFYFDGKNRLLEEKKRHLIETKQAEW